MLHEAQDNHWEEYTKKYPHDYPFYFDSDMKEVDFTDSYAVGQTSKHCHLYHSCHQKPGTDIYDIQNFKSGGFEKLLKVWDSTYKSYLPLLVRTCHIRNDLNVFRIPVPEKETGHTFRRGHHLYRIVVSYTHS